MGSALIGRVCCIESCLGVTMRVLRSLVRRSKSLLHGEVENSALSEEIQFHLERQTEENIARGMPPMQARSAAIAMTSMVAGNHISAQFARKLSSERGKGKGEPASCLMRLGPTHCIKY